MTRPALPLLLCLGLLGACAAPKMASHPAAAAESAALHEGHDHEQLWTCPHEGGVFHAPGKCPNSWCQLDLVPLKKK